MTILYALFRKNLINELLNNINSSVNFIIIVIYNTFLFKNDKVNSKKIVSKKQKKLKLLLAGRGHDIGMDFTYGFYVY